MKFKADMNWSVTPQDVEDMAHADYASILDTPTDQLEALYSQLFGQSGPLGVGLGQNSSAIGENATEQNNLGLPIAPVTVVNQELPLEGQVCELGTNPVTVVNQESSLEGPVCGLGTGKKTFENQPDRPEEEEEEEEEEEGDEDGEEPPPAKKPREPKKKALKKASTRMTKPALVTIINNLQNTIKDYEEKWAPLAAENELLRKKIIQYILKEGQSL